MLLSVRCKKKDKSCQNMKDNMTRLLDYLKSQENIELRVLFYILDSLNGKKQS